MQLSSISSSMAPHDNFKKSDQSYVPMIDIVAVRTCRRNSRYCLDPPYLLFNQSKWYVVFGITATTVCIGIISLMFL
jgi:hypothetical protein